MRRTRLCSALLVAAAMALRAAPLRAEPTAGVEPTPTALGCPTPDGYSPDEDLLGNVAAGMKRGHLRVLAIGSAALAGRGGATFADRMADVLRARQPGLVVDVAVRGQRGLTAAAMLDILKTELPREHYELVIWQTGTVEAVRNLPPGDLYDTLTEGAGLVQAAGADLILVDPQYSRFLQANADLDPYEQSLSQAAALPGVLLFHRFELMRAWADGDGIDLERADGDARPKLDADLQTCLGRFLARMVLLNAQAP